MKGLLLIIIFFISFSASALYFFISVQYSVQGENLGFVPHFRSSLVPTGRERGVSPPPFFDTGGSLSATYYLKEARACDRLSQSPLVLPGISRVMLQGEGRTNLCLTPEEIVIHWSESRGGNIVTHKTLEKRGLSCQFAVDKDETWQMLELYEDFVEAGYCTGVAEHNFKSVNIELAGSDFDDSPPPEAELDKALELTCFLLKQYNIPKDKILGHFEILPEKKDPGEKFLEKFKDLVRQRCS